MKLELTELLTHPVVAAAVGAAVGLRALPGATLPERAANLAAGFALAAWGGSAVVDYMNIDSPKIAAGMIFITGATGLVVFGAIIEGIKKTDLAAWITAWLPGKKGGE